MVDSQGLSPRNSLNSGFGIIVVFPVTNFQKSFRPNSIFHLHSFFFVGETNHHFHRFKKRNHDFGNLGEIRSIRVRRISLVFEEPKGVRKLF